MHLSVAEVVGLQLLDVFVLYMAGLLRPILVAFCSPYTTSIQITLLQGTVVHLWSQGIKVSDVFILISLIIVVLSQMCNPLVYVIHLKKGLFALELVHRPKNSELAWEVFGCC